MSYAALPVLRTPRLELRPLTDQDTDALVRGVGNYDVSRWLAVVPYPYDVDDARDFIARVQAQDKPFWGVHNARGLIGVVSLDDELSYWIARPYWGKGYGFEAAHAAVDFWFSDSKAATLASGYFDGNETSGDLLRALGFRLAERARRFAKSFQQDVISNQMRLTRADWNARQDFTLYTPRLTLRAIGDDDAKAIAGLSLPEIARNLSDFPPNMTVNMARTGIAQRQWRGLAGFSLGIEQDGTLIGWIGLGGLPISVGYALAQSHWGQGLMTEALSAFLPQAFTRLPMRRLTADHFEDNPASGAILQKFGFQTTGRQMLASKGRLEPAPVITYALERDKLRVPV